jgi:outer membrane protein assembly factor BamB
MQFTSLPATARTARIAMQKRCGSRSAVWSLVFVVTAACGCSTERARVDRPGALHVGARVTPAAGGADGEGKQRVPVDRKLSAKVRQGAAAKPTINAADLEAKRLEHMWELFLGERIRGAWQIGDAVFAYTVERKLYSIGITDGLLRWQYSLPEGLSFAPAAYEYVETDALERVDELLLISKDVLHVVDLEHGYLLWKMKLPFPASSGPAGSRSHIYVGSWDDRIYAVSKSGQHVGWSYRTDGPISAAVESTERGSVEAVFVGSEDGLVYSMSPVAEDRKWHVRTRDRIVGSPLYFRNFVYVASQDMSLYCIRAVDGNLEWKYATGTTLSQKPVGYDKEVIYVLGDNHRLIAVNRRPDVEGGYERWSRDGVERILAHGRRDVYVLDDSGSVNAVAEASGKERWQTPLEVGADLYVTNLFSANSTVKRERRLAASMVFGFESGWLVAVKEKSEY